MVNVMVKSKQDNSHEREITLEEDDFQHDEDKFDPVAGEEDPGAALETLVEYDKSKRDSSNNPS